MRKKTKVIKVGNKNIGGDSPILIQSMTNTKTSDADATIKQIKKLVDAGCEIIRVSVPDIDSVKSLKKIKENISIPIVADIHYDYKLAVEAAQFVDKLRINPGNMKNIDKVVDAAKKYDIPIRVGVNSGSIEKDIHEKYGQTPKAMFESVKRNVKLLEDLDFRNIVISAKMSNVLDTIEVYRMISKEFNYPLHLGVTEAGTLISGTIKSSIGIGSLLQEGIGDTFRVSLTDDPIEEIDVCKEILQTLKIRHFKPEIISCPTCARTKADIVKITKEIEKKAKKIKKTIKIAVMGCSVNGPGEAKHADIGIAFGEDKGVLFKKGEIIKIDKWDNLVKELLDEIENFN